LSERARLRELERRNRDLEMENAFLKKGVSCCSRSNFSASWKAPPSRLALHPAQAEHHATLELFDHPHAHGHAHQDHKDHRGQHQ
jgi:hypothetical protein